jgi:hypothetical protein
MGVLAPWFLAAAVAAGLPVYLHLLRRHSTTPRPFSSLMFFERRTQSSIKHRRLRYLLLLSLRLALLLLLILAFADPYISRPAASMTQDKLLLLVIDNSFSMHAGSRMDDARRQALALLSSRPSTERAQVMALGSQLQALTSATDDPGPLRAAVAALQTGDSRGSLSELARAMRSMSETVRTPIELHFFSDMQKSAMPASFAEMTLPANVSLVLHPVANAVVPNWVVESVNAPAQVWDLMKAHVEAVVAGYHTPTAKRTVSLVINGNTVATQAIDVPAGGRATVEFPTLNVPYGLSRCAVTIDSADALAADDSSLFAVERSDPAKALLVHNSSDSQSPVYFGAALAASADGVFTLQTATVEQAANLDPSKYAFIVLSNTLELPSAIESSLEKYVRGGGSVLVVAGNTAQRGSRIPVLDNKILDVMHYSQAGDGFLMVGATDPSHPSMENAEQWRGVKFYDTVRVDPGDSRVVARLSDGTPLLLDEKIGEGRVMLLTSNLDNIANDFPLHAIFVPFVEQTARYLSGTERRSGSQLVDSYLELRTAKEQSIGVEVVDPAGHRPLSLREASSQQSFQVTSAGFYQLRLANGRQDLAGVNADRRESDLDVIPGETLSLWRGNANTPAPLAATAGQAQEQKQPYPLWWYVMILVLAAAVAESLLASRYLGTQAEEP